MSVRNDYERLLLRSQQRWYPETKDALDFYRLKSFFHKQYGAEQWRRLDALLARNNGQFSSLRTWLRDEGLLNGAISPRRFVLPSDTRPPIGRDALLLYVIRLLNEWLPAEIARLLIDESGGNATQEGMPAIAIGRALERLLLREHISPATLNLLLEPELFSARVVYPAHYEILQDVVLYLLDRTDPPARSILPATLLCIAPDVPLSADYAEEVAHAEPIFGPDGERLQVSIPPSRTLQILRAPHVRITSVVLTADGRWWQADKLTGGDQNVVLYRPQGRLALSDSDGHARLRIPWPESRLEWPGPVSLPAPLEIFGRQWRVVGWEQAADGAWLHLEFMRSITTMARVARDGMRTPRSRTAGADMAWTAMANALAESLEHADSFRLEALRRHEMIPLGRALLALCQSALDRSQRTVETLETRLHAASFYQSSISSVYGPVPWRVLPDSVRATLLRPRLYSALGNPLHELFDALPAPARPLPWTRLWARRGSPHAA